MNVMFGQILVFLLIFYCLPIFVHPTDTNQKIEKAQKENLSKFLETNKIDENAKIIIFSSNGSEHTENKEKAPIMEVEHPKNSKGAILGSGYADPEFAGSDDEISSEEILWQPKQEKPEPEKRNSIQSIGKPGPSNSQPKHTNSGKFEGPEYKMWETGLVDWKSEAAKNNKAHENHHPEEYKRSHEKVSQNVKPENARLKPEYRNQNPIYSQSQPEYSAHTSEYASRRPEYRRPAGNQIPLYGGVRPRHVNPVPVVYNWHQMRGVHPELFRQAHSGPILLRRNSEFEVPPLFHARSAPVYAGWGPEQAGWNSSEDACSGSGSGGSRPSSTGSQSEQPIFEPDPVDFMNALRTKYAPLPASEKWYWDKVNQNTGPNSPPTEPSEH